jgi:hypothetical protein
MNSTLNSAVTQASFRLISPAASTFLGSPSFLSSSAVVGGESFAGWHVVSGVEGYLADAHVDAAAANAANPMEAGRIAVAATAWDITGCAPKFQATSCTTAKNKTKKRPLSWSGPPTG